MDVPACSRRRCREVLPSSERNVLRRCSIPDLVASRRRRRDEAAAATLAARVGAVAGRNVRPRQYVLPAPLTGTAIAASASDYVPIEPRRYMVASEFSSGILLFFIAALLLIYDSNEHYAQGTISAPLCL